MAMMTRVAMFLFCGGLAAASIGCGGGDPTYEIDTGTLSGKIDGAAWKFVSGETDSFLSDEKSFFTKLYAEKVDACGFSSNPEYLILLDVPAKVGDYDLGFTQNVTLAHNSDNNVATTGKLSVTSVTDTKIEAGVYAIFGDDPDNEVNGQFTATICAATP